MPRVAVNAELIVDTDSRTCSIQMTRENAQQVVNFLNHSMATTGLKDLDIITKAMAERKIKEFVAEFIKRGYLSFASIGDAFKLVIKVKPDKI